MNTRLQLILTMFVTLVGIVGVVTLGWRALDSSSHAAARAEKHLERILSIEDIEERVHVLQESQDAPERAAAARDIGAALKTLRAAGWNDAEDLALLDEIQQMSVAASRGDASRQALNSAGRALPQLARSVLGTSRSDLTGPSRLRTQSAATRLAKYGGILVVVFGALSTVLFLRLRRERGAAERELREKDRLAALGTIAASVAHELNNPLATVAGCASSVRGRAEGFTGADREHVIEYLDLIQDEVRRCSKIVGGLRDLAREQSLAVTSVVASELVEDVVKLVELDRSDKQIAITSDVDPDVAVVCDSDKIKQLLLNLLVNARDACDADGNIRVSVQRDGSAHLRLHVEDDGRGMSARDLSRVFEPFHSSKVRGLGIGLFICRRIVSLHNGTIRAFSAGTGRGARFEVRLPTGFGEGSPEPVPSDVA